MLLTVCRRRVASTNPRLSSLVHHDTHAIFLYDPFVYTHIAKEAGNKAIQHVRTIPQPVRLHAPFPGT